MAWKRSTVRTRPGPPNQQLARCDFSPRVQSRDHTFSPLLIAYFFLFFLIEAAAFQPDIARFHSMLHARRKHLRPCLGIGQRHPSGSSSFYMIHAVVVAYSPVRSRLADANGHGPFLGS